MKLVVESVVLLVQPVVCIVRVPLLNISTEEFINIIVIVQKSFYRLAVCETASTCAPSILYLIIIT